MGRRLKINFRLYVCVALALGLFALADSLSLAAPASKALNAQFLAAAKSGNVFAVRRTLDRGANVNAKDEDGNTALLSAIRPSYEGGVNHTLINYLLSRRANVHIGNGTGQNALMAAASVGDLNLVKLLLSKGARVNAEDKNGQTALFYAAGGASDDNGDDRSSPAIVKLLLSKKARVNVVDAYGQTPLIAAARCATSAKAAEWAVTQTARLLLAAGATTHNTTASGFTAMKWAQIRKHPGIMRMIQARMKKGSPAARKSSAPADPHAGHH